MAISGSLRHGCRLLPTRSVRYHISISLVKSDWKPQQKTGPLPVPFPAAAFPSAMALIKIDSRMLMILSLSDIDQVLTAYKNGL